MTNAINKFVNYVKGLLSQEQIEAAEEKEVQSAIADQTTAKEIVHITPRQLVDVLLNLNGCAFVGVDLVMSMDRKNKMLKKGRLNLDPETDAPFVDPETGIPIPQPNAGLKNPFFNIGLNKRETISACLGFSYANAVNNQLEREGKEANYDSNAGVRAWGDPTILHPVTGEIVTFQEMYDRGEKDLIPKSKAYKLIQHKGEWYLHLMGFSYSGKVMGVNFGVPIFEDREGLIYSKEQLKDFMPKPSQSKRQGTDKAINNHDCRLDSVVSIRMLGREYIVTEAAPAIAPEHRINASQVEQVEAGTQVVS